MLSELREMIAGKFGRKEEHVFHGKEENTVGFEYQI